MKIKDAAIQLNLAWSRQEVKRQNNKLHQFTFQNKTLRVDTSTHCEASCLPYCAIADSNFLFLAFLAGWAGCIFSATVTKWMSSPATPYFYRGVCWIFPASVKRNVCTSRGGRDRTRHEGIWPIHAIRAGWHGLVSFFSVLQLPQRSNYFRSFFWIHSVLTTLSIGGSFDPV